MKGSCSTTGQKRIERPAGSGACNLAAGLSKSLTGADFLWALAPKTAILVHMSTWFLGAMTASVFLAGASRKLCWLSPNNSFKPSPHQGGAQVHAFGYIALSRRPDVGRLNSGVRPLIGGQWQLEKI